MIRFGNEVNYWLETESGMDISRGAKKVSSISTTTFQVAFDPKRSALIVIDMQNFFCSERLGRSDTAINLAGAISKSVKHAREIGMRIIWLNWGVRPDLANLSPGVLRSFYRSGIYAGFGAELEGGLGPILTKTSWSADLIPELNEARSNEDIWVDKYRTSGFYGTELEQILMAQGITTLFFAGVNTDQCVFGTLQDAHCLGYDCVILTDCTATSSPVGAYESVVYNVERSYGFATTSKEFCASMSTIPD
ncbi:MAG: cysteine hydrolase family protein [Desulfitobacteriaceae bacterium]